MEIFDINTVFFTIRWYDMSYLEFFGTIFNIICVRLASRNNIRNRPIGIIGVILYIFLFYQIQLYADFIEQRYFLITGFYGWRAWSNMKKKKTAKDGELKVMKTTKKENIIYGIIGVIATVLLTFLIMNLSIWFPTLFPEPASYPYLDALTTVMSFLATILMARRKISCWYLWIAVDIIGIRLYYIKGVKFVALEYVIFLILATLWLFRWIKIYKQGQKKSDTDMD